jgi:hypothetical protein
MALVVFAVGQRAKSADVNSNFSGLSDGSLDVTSNQLSYFRRKSFLNHVYSGMTMATSANLTTSLASGEAIVNGKFVTISTTSITVSASKDTYVYLKDDGTVSYTGALSVANGAASPTAPTNTDGSVQMLLGKLVSGATAITSVTQTGVDSNNVNFYPTSPISQSWKTYTPTFNNTTLGSGTVSGSYMQIGKTVYFRASFALGAGSAVGSSPNVTFPVTSVAPSSGLIGWCYMVDTGVVGYTGYLQHSNTSVATLIACIASGTYVQASGLTSAIPFAWGNTDVMYVAGVYEAA